MSIAEKLVQVAENTPKVCEAVQSAKREVNGTVVVAHDISTIEHSVEVKLTNDSETPTDFSGVTVKQNGKNQLNYVGWSYINQNTVGGTTVKTDTTITSQGKEGSANGYSSGGLSLRFPNSIVHSTNQTITISFYATLLEQGAFSDRIRLFVQDTSYNIQSAGNAYVTLTLNERKKVSFTLTPTVDIAGVMIYLNNNKIMVEMDTLQIEYGYEATDFEAYKEPITYTANADGTVDGVMSLAPSMTLVSGDKEAVINCRYFPVEAVGVRTAYADLVDAETALRDRLGEGVV